MDRRHFLAASGTAATLGLAGCSSLSTTTLTPATEEDGDRTIHLQYHDGDEHVATISFMDRWREDSHDRYFPLRLHLWKENGLEGESIRYEFRETFPDHPPRYYLERPSGTWEPIQFSRTDDGQATLLDVPDLGFQGRGSITMDILVENRNEEPLDIDISVDASLSGGRLSTDYELTGQATREIPAWNQ